MIGVERYRAVVLQVCVGDPDVATFSSDDLSHLDVGLFEYCFFVLMIVCLVVLSVLAIDPTECPWTTSVRTQAICSGDKLGGRPMRRGMRVSCRTSETPEDATLGFLSRAAAGSARLGSFTSLLLRQGASRKTG